MTSMRIEPIKADLSKCKGKPLETTSETYDDLMTEIQGKNKEEKLIVLVFSSSFCTPCKKLKQKIFSEITGEGISERLHSKFIFFYVDVQNNGECVEYFKLLRIPHVEIGRITKGRFEKQISMTGSEADKLEEHMSKL